jgi:hypothetical protein
MDEDGTYYGTSNMWNWQPPTKQCSGKHTWIDTGMRKLYCKHCDYDGHMQPDGTIVATAPIKRERSLDGSNT